MQATDSKNKVVYWGTGRRKSAVASVRLVPGTGAITVNGRDGETHFNRIPTYIQTIKAPLETLGLENEYDIIVKAEGGGLTGRRMR